MADEKDTREYVTFHVTSRDGADVELAVVDEFEYKHKHYVVGAVVKDDCVMEEDGVFIYRGIPTEDDFEVEPIRNAFDFEEIAKAYAEMSEQE